MAEQKRRAIGERHSITREITKYHIPVGVYNAQDETWDIACGGYIMYPARKPTLVPLSMVCPDCLRMTKRT